MSRLGDCVSILGDTPEGRARCAELQARQDRVEALRSRSIQQHPALVEKAIRLTPVLRRLVERAAPPRVTADGWKVRDDDGTTVEKKVGNRTAAVHALGRGNGGGARLWLFDDAFADVEFISADGFDQFSSPAAAKAVAELWLSGDVSNFVALQEESMHAKSRHSDVVLRAAQMRANLQHPLPPAAGAPLRTSIVRRAIAGGQRTALRLEEDGRAFTIRATPNSADLAGRPSFAFSVRSAVRRGMGLSGVHDDAPRPGEVRRMGVADAVAQQDASMTAALPREMREPQGLLPSVHIDPYTGLRFYSREALVAHAESNYTGGQGARGVLGPWKGQRVPGSPVPTRKA